MSLLLNEATCKKAVEMVLPAIQLVMKAGIAKRHDLHIVIADPAFLPSDLNVSSNRFDIWYDEGIAYEHSLGDKDLWEYPYDEIARSKTYLTWRYGMPTQILQIRAPHLLQPGNTIHFGSAISDGLVVGVSGVQAHFDQMFAAWILEACRALCINARETDKLPNDGNFATRA